MNAPASPRTGPLAPFFPLPLVGASVLLAVLIVLTPNLLSAGSPSAGSLETQAELLVDRAASGDSATHLYLRGLGLARYQSIDLRWAPLYGSAPAHLQGVPWTGNASANDSLGVSATLAVPEFAVNASAVFVDSSGAWVRYQEAFAFHWVDGRLLTTPYGADASIAPAPLDQMPLVLLLPETAFGGPS